MTRLDYDIDSEIMPWASVENIKDGAGKVDGEGMLFPRYSKLDGAYRNAEIVDAYVSEQVSNEQGVFDNKPVFEARFRKLKTCYGFSIRFNSQTGDKPIKAVAEWYDKKNKLVKTDYMIIDDLNYRLFSDIEYFLYVRITFEETSKPNRPVFIESFNFESLYAYEGLKIIYDGRAPGAIENSYFESDDMEPTLSFLPWLRDGSNNPYAFALPNYSKLDYTAINYDGDYMAGFVSKDISDAEGNFATPIVLTATFADGLYSSSGVHLIFDPNTRDWVNNLEVVWYRDSTELARKTYIPDKYDYFCVNAVRHYNKVVVTMYSTNNPYRHAIVSLLQLGHVVIYTERDVVTNSVHMDASQPADSLTANTLDFTVKGIDEPAIFQRTQKLEVYFDGDLQSVFYAQYGNQTSFVGYSVYAEDASSLMDSEFYGHKIDGGYLAEWDTTAEQIISEIMEGTNVEYYLDETLIGKPVKGILKVMSRREALLQVAFAIGAVVDMFGTEKINILSATSDKELTDLNMDDVFQMNVEYLDVATKVELTVLTPAFKEKEAKVGSAGIEDTQDIILKDPAIITSTKYVANTVPEGILNVVTVTPDYSQLDPKDKRQVVLTGQKYEPGEYVIHEYNPIYSEAEHEMNVVSAKGDFVNEDNAQEVLERLFNYYTKEKQVSLSTYDLNIAPRDKVQMVLWDGSIYQGTVISTTSNYSQKVYAEVTLR